MISWNHITGIGDTVVMMPAAAMIAAWLLPAGARRLAMSWCLMFGGALACVLATKIAPVGAAADCPGQSCADQWLGEWNCALSVRS